MISKYKKHIPFHLYIDKGIYFVTARTINGKEFFDNEVKINILVKKLNQAIKKYNAKMHAWVVLTNHYHVLFSLSRGNQLSLLIQYINGSSSYEINKLENKKGRKIWWNYWDKNIREETDFYKRINYIHHNPLKHKSINKIKEYKYSSYHHYLKKYGEEWLNDCFEQYPIIDFSTDEKNIASSTE